MKIGAIKFNQISQVNQNSQANNIKSQNIPCLKTNLIQDSVSFTAKPKQPLWSVNVCDKNGIASLTQTTETKDGHEKTITTKRKVAQLNKNVRRKLKISDKDIIPYTTKLYSETAKTYHKGLIPGHNQKVRTSTVTMSQKQDEEGKTVFEYKKESDYQYTSGITNKEELTYTVDGQKISIDYLASGPKIVQYDKTNLTQHTEDTHITLDMDNWQLNVSGFATQVQKQGIKDMLQDMTEQGFNIPHHTTMQVILQDD